MSNQLVIEALEHALAVFRSLGERGFYPQELLPWDGDGKESPLFMGKQGLMFLINAIEEVKADTPTTQTPSHRPPVTWDMLGNWYNHLCHASMYIDEREPGNAQVGVDHVLEELTDLRNAQGPNESYHSLAIKETK